MTDTAAANLSRSTALSPNILLSTPTTDGATVDVSVQLTNGTTINESGAYFEAPLAETS